MIRLTARDLSFMIWIWILCMMNFHPHQLIVEARYSLVEANSPETFVPIFIQGPIKKSNDRSIRIVGNEFMLDGKPLHIVSGSVHYFRLPWQYWRDRLRKLKAAGFNAVSTYVEWSYHEPEYRQYHFTEDRNVRQFVQIAAQEGLFVLLRPGPYICAERDLGGLPYWLLQKYPHIKLRSADKNFMNETSIWMAKLFTELKDLLYDNGGPIILVQIENEYGSYGNDTNYKVALRDVIKSHVNGAALLYTTDGTSKTMIQGGAVAGTLTTIDFGIGGDLKKIFRPLRNFMPVGPLMNSEFYPGWLTHWGESLQQVSTERVVASLRDMLANKINVNMYVFFGGSNFEFSAGANYGESYQPDITSYDYDAPLNEAGDPTPKYYAIRKAMEEYVPDLKNITPPTPNPKKAYGKVAVTGQVNLLSSEGRAKLGVLHHVVQTNHLPTFESLSQRSGLVLYETELEDSDAILNITKPRDRVYVYVDGIFQGIISRMHKTYALSIKSKPKSILSLLVENQGRINFGSRLHDSKGILSVVKYNNTVLNGKWTITGYPLEHVDVDSEIDQLNTMNGPALFKGQFTLPDDQDPVDTFLDTTGWRKGYVWINGHNLGRYWPLIGPQVTLYMPGVWLQRGQNTIQILELEETPEDLSLTFIDHPILNGTNVLTTPINFNDFILNTT